MNKTVGIQTLIKKGLRQKVQNNFFAETQAALVQHQLSEADVSWVGSADGQLTISWQEFKTIAETFNLTNAMWGGDYVAVDLVVVGSDWWLERVSDEQNWPYWRLCRKPQQSPMAKKFTRINSDSSYDSLAELN